MAKPDLNSITPPPVTVAVDGAELMRLRAENEELKRAAAKAPKLASELYDGPTRKYRISVAHYCKGEYFPAGSIITKPSSEQPSVHWEAIEDEPAPTATAPASPTPSGRAADRSV